MASGFSWFHPKCSGTEADALLKGFGKPGGFLLRPSKTQVGVISISAMGSDGNVEHIRVVNLGDTFCLGSGNDSLEEHFASLPELVEFYMRGDARIYTNQDKDPITFVHPLPCKNPSPTSERWYHGSLKGPDSKQMLLESGNGGFLVRLSEKTPGDLILSVNVNGTVANMMIRHRGEKYAVSPAQPFDSVKDLIDHYIKNPIQGGNGQVVQLLNPMNGTQITKGNISARTELLKRISSATDKTGFAEEFDKLEQICPLEAENGSRDMGADISNKGKNRYRNILPFDRTRVKITPDPKDPKSTDYINANFVQLPGSTPYIACQGPLPQTAAAFWQMIVENGVRVIVMTTKLIERGKHKCCHYWPTIGLTYVSGNIRVKCMLDQDLETYTVRNFVLSHGKKKWNVYQFHYTSWPDHGVPDNPGTVLKFLADCRAARKHDGDMSVPVVVHCSAGIGRTGTFIAIDHIINNESDSVDVFNTVLGMRQMRSGMVQTDEQYQFIYEASEEYMKNPSSYKKE